MNYNRYIIILFIMFGLFSCKQKTDKNKSKDKSPAIVDVIIAEKVNFPTSIEVNGTALSEEMVVLYPEISGKLTVLNIPDGASVAEGTVLAKINDAELQAQMEQQKAQLELAVKTEQRLKKLLAVNGVNQSDYDIAINQVNSINANIKVLNAQIDKTIIKAPFSGKLGLRMVSVGAFVTQQTILGTLQKTDKIKIDFTVPEVYKNNIKIGNKVKIQTTSSDTFFFATISAIEPQINTTTRNIKVRANFYNNNISPGAFVKVIIEENEKGIVVPTNAIIPDALSNQVVVIKNGKGVFVNVETGTRNADLVKITKGLEVGDSIVVSGVLFVRPDAKVKINKVKNISELK